MPLTRAQRLKQGKGGDSLFLKSRANSKMDSSIAALLPHNLIAQAWQFWNSKTVKQWMKKNIGEVASTVFLLTLIAHFYLTPIQKFSSNMVTLQCVTGYNNETMFSGDYLPCSNDLIFAVFFSLAFICLIFFLDTSVPSIMDLFSINLGLKGRAKYSENLIQFYISFQNVVVILVMMIFNFNSGKKNNLNFMKLQNEGSYMFHEKLIFVLQVSQLIGWMLYSLATVKKFATIQKRLLFNAMFTFNTAVVYAFVMPKGFVWLLCMHSVLAFISIKDLLKKTHNTVLTYLKHAIFLIFLASLVLYVVDSSLKYDSKDGDIRNIITREDSMILVILVFVPSLVSC